MKRLLIACLTLATTPAFAEYINHANDKNWAATVKRIEKLSAAQFGQVQRSHSCWDQKWSGEMTHQCVNTVEYVTDKGMRAIIRVIRNDATGEILTRDVCRFNSNETLRFCIDFDSGEKTTYSKANDWKAVGEESDETDSGGGLQ